MNVSWNRKAMEPLFPCGCNAPWHVREEMLYPLGCFLVFFCRSSVRHHFIQLKMHSGACGQKCLMTWWVRALLQWWPSWGGGLRELNGKCDWEREKEKGKQVSRANSIKPVRHFSFVHSYHLSKRYWWVPSFIFQLRVSKWDFISPAHCDWMGSRCLKHCVEKNSEATPKPERVWELIGNARCGCGVGSNSPWAT